MPESQPIRLGLVAETASLSIGEKIALNDARVRTHVSYAVAGAFVLANMLTLAGVAYIFREDNRNIVAKLITPSERVITSPVVMTIIGATTIQLGALALAMGKYLYPKGRDRTETARQP